MVTVYNQDTFEIGKIRVNRVITVKALIAKIAAHFEVPEVKDLVVRLGDLNLTFDAKSSERELAQRLFSDLEFSEANMIGVQVINASRELVLNRKRERQAAERELSRLRKQQRTSSGESLSVLAGRTAEEHSKGVMD